MNNKKRFDSLTILSLGAFALSAILMIVFYSAIFGQFASNIEYKGQVMSYLAYVKNPDINTYSQGVAVLVFLPIATLFSGALFFDCLLRKGVSHIAVTVSSGLAVVAYLITNAIVEFATGSKGASIFLILASIAGIALVFFFIQKMLDGDATLGYKISGGLCGVFALFGICLAYPFLDAYSHADESIFWGGGFLGIAILIILAVTFYVSVSSDYDPNPIEIDEFGNPIE